jgi:hypothetical protein
VIVRVEELRSAGVKGALPGDTVRAIAAVAAMAREFNIQLRHELHRVDNFEEMRRAEILSPRPLPSVLVIDEVGPPHSSDPGPTPRFGQLSSLRRQRSR